MARHGWYCKNLNTMKKAIAFIAVIIFSAFQNSAPKERSYKIEIPQSQINAFWAVTHGQEDNLTIGDYKAVMQYIEIPLQQQAYAYHIEDSIAALKVRKDTGKGK